MAKDEKTKELGESDEAREAREKAEWESGSAVSRRFLLGDLTKIVMAEIMQLQIPWGALDEKGQEKVINTVSTRVKAAVHKVVDIIVADGKVSEQVVIESVLFKDGIKLVIQMGKSAEGRHAIADAAGGTALLVLRDSAKYDGGDPPKADKDQPDLLGDATGGGMPGEVPPAGNAGDPA